MTTAIDVLTAPTLKHVQDQWWDDTFTEFLAETLRPRPGNRILDVGCGEGEAEVSIGRLQISQIRLFGVDLVPAKAAQALRETRSHNQPVGIVAGDACRLPFRTGVFDATFCVAVLQYIGNVSDAIAEIGRVTAPGRRVVIVEPDNAARYLHSSVPAGALAQAAATRFFAAMADARERATHPAVGPRVPSLLATAGIEAVDVRLFPVTSVQLGAPPDEVWVRRRAPVEKVIAGTATDRVRDAAMVFLAALDAYRTEAAEANTAFVEIQNTMLFATVGQKPAARR